VEDDPGDALLAQEHLGTAMNVTWVDSVAGACELLTSMLVDCVLLDMNLPDTIGFDGLERLQATAPDVAIVVLTGETTPERGIAAVSAGAQDYLVKGQVDSATLTRAVLYATERKRTDSWLRQLASAQIRHEENVRLERGLLPVPLLGDASVEVVTRYRPGRAQAQLGGDFFDAVQTADRRLWVMVGDVAGHGPDEAALGVALRVGWRTLVLAGHQPTTVLPALQKLLVHERHSDELFATLCMLVIDADCEHAGVFLAGHPAPLIMRGSDIVEMDAEAGMALGIVDEMSWTPSHVTLGSSWSLLCFTDGIVEGFADPHARLGVEGLIRLLIDQATAEPDPTGGAGELLDRLIEQVVARNGGPMLDDLALVHVRSGAQVRGSGARAE
jgi:serine phosphatase RsbU (regulator of sigma subunit)